MKAKGFSLIEAILTLVLVSGGILGILHLFEQNVRSANFMEQTASAAFLAQERLEQIVQDKEYQGFDTIISANYPASEDLTAQGFGGFTRTVSILEVNANDLTSPAPPPGSGYKRITVTVSVTGGEGVTLETLLTEWGTP